MSDPGLTLLTATGARHEAWALCQAWMRRQDYTGAVRWIIVDDGPEPQPLGPMPAGWTIDLIRPHPPWQPGQNTQSRNLQAGIKTIGDKARVVIIEDDDWYGPQWLSTVASRLASGAHLIGESHNRYWHVGQRRALAHGNTRHASLCATAMQGAALALFRRLVTQPLRFHDLALWRRFNGRKSLQPSAHVVGLKGMPGRAGVCSEHTAPRGQPDPVAGLLVTWVGPEDAARILEII